MRHCCRNGKMVDEKGVPNVIIAEEDLHVLTLMMGTSKMDGYLPNKDSSAEECIDMT